MWKVIYSVAAAVLLAGCSLSGLGGAPASHATSPAITLTQYVAPSALLTVTAGRASGPALSGLVAATARPDEDLRILQSGAPVKTIVAADSPAPASVVLPGPPAAPGSGETDYQSARYAKQVTAWRARRDAEVQAEGAQTRQEVSRWLSGLAISQKLGALADPPGDEGTLAAESPVAASALADLDSQAGTIFGSRRVIVLFCDDLSGTIPAGELTGDDVIVVTAQLPTEAAASTAQADLLGAGAAQAAVVGPEVTAAQLDALVSAGLSQGTGRSDLVSAPVLFGNDSYALSAGAVGELRRLLPRLREAGTTAVINGYASTPGTAQANYVLSFERATAVAHFFESQGIPAASLIIVGHGASGASGANRRVLVVVE
jgi:outer membrane protein OmpA-like peptidoglycan-associated protein